MHWLRRISAETRIVALVVFLAFLQAILLSVFGLIAISGERQQAEANLEDDALAFLRTNVARRCRDGLRDAAEVVYAAAFDAGRADWKAEAAGNLFTDAFSVQDDGTVLTSDGLPCWVPPERRASEQQKAVAAAAGARGLDTAVLEPAQQAALDLDLARRFPFARDAFGGSLALLQASSPVLEAEPDFDVLLAARWVGLINRVAAYGDAHEVDAFLARVVAPAGDAEPFKAACAEQDRQANVLAALLEERPRFLPGQPPVLHRNAITPADVAFFVRSAGATGALQVLATSRVAVREFLQREVAASRGEASEGVRPALVEVPAAPANGAPTVVIDRLPGWMATATISGQAILERSRDRERVYWYIIGFSVAGILAGGFLTARAVMREVKLAKLKSGFVSNVSHALKTPLTSIRMFSDMLRSGRVRDEAERRECLDVIAQETTRLGTLIQQVLDFGRLEARRRVFHWTTALLGPLVQGEAERFRRATGLDEDRLEVRIAINLPRVTFDPDAFSELLTNLLSNAYKYSPPEDRRIVVTLGPFRGRVVLAVEDNGPGIDPRERRKIFDQFYRANDLLNRNVEGTGLGLSIVRSIVRAHGGRILVEDSSLGGSRFAVILPAAQEKRRVSATSPAETTR